MKVTPASASRRSNSCRLRRTTRLKDAFGNYCKQRRGGDWVDFPADGHPEEDLMDALRGGIRDAMPEGRAPQPNLSRVHVSSLR